jgi:hypothetical protein
MKVYVVFEETPFGDEFDRIFKNQADAEQFVKECGDIFHIEEHEVIE